tara:strand:- start:113 stop:553 length:441 start_codon:yes stop_codon:yes gene_type:complete
MNILNLSNKILRGYISSREIGGSFYPQNLQNLLIRSFAYDNKINLQLSGTEWNIKNSYLMLRSIIKDTNDGVIFFSLFQLLENEKNFLNFSKEILNKKKILVFCLENIVVSDFSQAKLIIKKLKVDSFSRLKNYHINFNSLKKLKN